MIDAKKRDPEISRLVAERKKELPATDTDAHDKTEDGDKIKVIKVRGPAEISSEIEINLSKLFRPTPSTTGDMDLLKTEAELSAEGTELGNSHVPIDEDTLERFLEWCEQNDMIPAWEQ